jgi:hypothetical protein
MGLAGHGALWVNPELFKLDPGLRRGDDCSSHVPKGITIVGLLITIIIFKNTLNILTGNFWKDGRY